MRYLALLQLLRILMYVKRFCWWTGTQIYLALAKIAAIIWYAGGSACYKITFLLKKTGIDNLDSWILRRRVLQIIFFALLFIITIPETKVYTKKDTYLPGRDTIAYNIAGSEEDYEIDEIASEVVAEEQTPAPGWREGAVRGDQFGSTLSPLDAQSRNIPTAMINGTALAKPFILPGAFPGGRRNEVMDYIVQPGDSLSSIAYEFGVSVATIMWENNLSLRSIIRPDDRLRVPPATGVLHAVKRGETLKKIASLYEASVNEIIKFNKLKEDGSDIVAGEKLMIPGGVKPEQRAVARAPRSYAPFRNVAVPPPSLKAPSLAGFVWPTAAKLITQYFTWRHSGLDIAGAPKGTPIYAAKAGVVEKSQCGWNSGYGCVIVLNHGGGIKTLYGHNSRLLVSVGNEVSAGQTIALMGNTGQVRGRTGIHLHFEIWSNGRKLNPLGYVR